MIEKGSATHSASSGDPTLDRRYAWAEAALKDGDPAACVEILDQTLAEAYHFTAAWHLYGLAQEALGHNEEAATAWRQCLTLDPNDHFGARLDLARIGAMSAEEATSENFSGVLFDGYADRFDSHLVEALRYNAPALLMDALRRVRPLPPASAMSDVSDMANALPKSETSDFGGEGLGMGGRAEEAQTTVEVSRPGLSPPPRPSPPQAGGGRRFETVYDLGCGTGLMGEAIRAETGFLAGCDLSPRMIERARSKRGPDDQPLYDKLAVAGLTSFLVSRPDASADLVIAADVFVYLGELSAVFAQSARVLKLGDLLAFTVQSHPGDGVVVGADRRFAHSEGWLRERLAAAGLRPVLLEPASTREDRGVAVPGLIVVAERG